MRCSQLSIARSNSAEARSRAKVSAIDRPGSSLIISARATACATSAGSEIGPSSTHHTPSSKRSVSRDETASARRVFPEPPGPVSVSRRVSVVKSSSNRRPPARDPRSLSTAAGVCSSEKGSMRGPQGTLSGGPILRRSPREVHASHQACRGPAPGISCQFSGIIYVLGHCRGSGASGLRTPRKVGSAL
jgi:hypothetical protein